MFTDKIEPMFSNVVETIGEIILFQKVLEKLDGTVLMIMDDCKHIDLIIYSIINTQ